ncbi:hypothetical protein [Pedococcus bigeumensis]|uniref:Membrane protein YfhO n=1 Tax=Pedococcus bigeumensis TaxID=433644 RepID=A0A502D149_9MICO|nr:hypothetical protein [Pedococcus bigeumensis]TPG17846.1 hypothetical protein EAH86_05265 [Pedococcus bigeumensis]
MERLRPSTRLLPVATAVVATVVVLGPALGRGVVLAYDLAWSPDARLTPFALGTDTPAPRAVPSDAVTVLLGWLVTPAVAQKLVLVGILLLAALGAAALLRQLRPDAGVVAACAVTVAAVWNPFVAERLVVGQWTVLIGYAVLPWSVRACLRVRAGSGSGWAVCGWLVLAGLGGANAWVLVVPTTLGLLTFPRPRWRELAAAFLVAVGVGAAWWLPAIVRGAPSSDAGVTAFAAHSDSLLGVLGSLLGGGGFWNPSAYPPERDVTVLVLVGAVLAIAGVAAVGTSRAGRPLVVVGAAGLLVAAVSGWAWTRPAWRLVAELPGGGLARDGQKFAALWLVVAVVGLGVVVDRLVRRGGVAPFAAVALALVGPLTLPSLAWGVHGRVAAVEVPRDLRDAATLLSRSEPGEVALLPWRQYRRYGWNEDRVSLSLVPRLVDQQVRYDDSLPLSSGSVPGEDPRAAAVSRAIAGGATEWQAVADTRPRYVVVERDTGLAEQTVPAGAGRVLADTSHVLVVELAGPEPVQPGGDSSLAGWTVTLVTLVLTALGAARHAVGRMRRERAPRFAKVRA